MRLVVSGGGTAGHISPILATIEALRELEPDLEILYVGQQGGMEQRIAAANHLAFAGISAGKWRRNANLPLWRNLADLPSTALNLRDLGRIVAGLTQSVQILRRFRPDVVFVKGGFVGLPVGLAASILRIPYIIHESDLVPGRTNVILARRAQQIAVGFPAVNYKMWPADKLVFTGNPTRRDLTKHHRLEGIAHFHLSTELPVVLVMGGSQGARAINEVVVKALPQLLEISQVIHITGEGEFHRVGDSLQEVKLPHPERYVRRAFLLEDMGEAYAASDIVVGRAGANTIADLAALGRPAILIPNYLMAGHQVHNATTLSRAGAAKVLREQNLTSAKLTAEIKDLLESEPEQSSLGHHIKQFGVPDGAEQLATAILHLAPGEDS